METGRPPAALWLRTGNQLIAEAAMEAGCRFFAGYPITPASGIYKGMLDLLQARGDVAISAPDEISALAYCVGASMRGFRSMTATSGPGWALMIETFQYALMTETPLVVALVQRLGPSTGGATQGAQGDVLFAEYCTSGGYTVPVFAPGTPSECFELTMLAFRWSEILRTPVIVLADKEVGMTVESVDESSLIRCDVPERPMGRAPHGAASASPTYGFETPSGVPLFRPVGGPEPVTITGSAHNMEGELKKNDPATLEVLRHLEEKILHRRREMATVKSDLQEGAKTLVVSFGITSRAAREGVLRARRKGKKVSFLSVLSLFPVPAEAIAAAAGPSSTVLVAEENLGGQYRMILSGVIPSGRLRGLNKIGSMITPAEIEAAVE